MEDLALAEVGEIAGQHSLDVVGLLRQEIARSTGEVGLDTIGTTRAAMLFDLVRKEFQESVVSVGIASG